MSAETVIYDDVRWQCDCGRFIAGESITHVDQVDPGAYYGISTDCSYECGRCGTVDRLPKLVTIATRQMIVGD